MWHEATIFIFLHTFLLLAFKHGVQGHALRWADDYCLEQRTHIPKKSVQNILEKGPSPIAPTPRSPLEAVYTTTNGPLRHGGLDGTMEENMQRAATQGLVGKVWCGVALFRHSLV